jgi:hypothetical protein
LLWADPAFSRGSALASALRRPDHRRYDIVLVEFVNTTHPNTAPNRCARPETPDPTLRPIGVGADAAGYQDRGAAEKMRPCGERASRHSFAGEITLTEEFAYREWSRWGWRSPKGE